MGAFGILGVLSLSTLAAGEGVGDFVASGLGLADSTSSGSDGSTASASSASSASILTASQSLATGGSYGNVSVDECWSSWEEYWSWHQDKTEIHSSAVETSYGSQVITFGQNASTGDAYTTTIDTVRTIDNGGFDISTQTIDTTSVWTDIDSAYPTSTVTSKYTYTSYSTFKEKPSTTITKPACTLPKEVSQCQDQWEDWISTVLEKPTPTPPPGCDVGAGFLNGRSVPPCASSYGSAQGSYYTWQQSQSDKIPACTQASIGGALCESIRDDYVQMKADWFAPPGYATAFFFSAGYLGTFQNVTAGNMQPSYYWPTAQTLSPAPSCTVGCGRCAVTGGTVDVLYWPATQTATGGPAATAPVTLETLGTTLTSPTLYISYSNLYASNGCSGVGTTISSTIVPIPPDQTLSSVYAGTIGCDAHFRMTQVWTASASFNVADLNEPVPYSIYSSQPWCQTYLRNQNCQGTCPSDTPYKPIVVVPQEVLQQLQPEWSECFGDIRGAYDPPKALQPVATASGPSEPEPTGESPPQTTWPGPATPAESPGPTTPSPTGGVGSSPTSYPDVESDQNPAPVESGSESPDTTTQNAGGAIASLLGPSVDDPEGDIPTATQNAGGIVASLLDGNTAQPDNSPADPNDPLTPTTVPGTTTCASDGSGVYGTGSDTSTLTMPSEGQNSVEAGTAGTATDAATDPSSDLTATLSSIPQATGNDADNLSSGCRKLLYIATGLVTLICCL